MTWVVELKTPWDKQIFLICNTEEVENEFHFAFETFQHAQMLLGFFLVIHYVCSTFCSLFTIRQLWICLIKEFWIRLIQWIHGKSSFLIVCVVFFLVIHCVLISFSSLVITRQFWVCLIKKCWICLIQCSHDTSTKLNWISHPLHFPHNFFSGHNRTVVNLFD